MNGEKRWEEREVREEHKWMERKKLVGVRGKGGDIMNRKRRGEKR